MQIIDLFSGIGGFSLAGEWMGWRTIQFCEIDSFCQKVLKYYWSDIPIHDDIKTLTAQQVFNNPLYDKNEISIVTGGFPCQPFSHAGKRKGYSDNRYLWSEMFAFIKEFRPDWILAENVYGIVNWNEGLVFTKVQINLESEDYEVLPVIIPACSVNAPHRRDRIWFIAKNSNISRNTQSKLQYSDILTRSSRNNKQTSSNTSGNAISEQNGEGIEVERTRETIDEQIRGGQFKTIQHEGLEDLSRYVTNSSKSRLEKRIRGASEGIGFTSKSKIITNSFNKGLQGGKEERDIRIEGKESNKLFTRFIQPDWENFPTQSPLCSRNDGISSKLVGITFPKHRNESIKAYGNAIVPQVAYQIFKAIESYIVLQNE